jgi:transposase
MNGYSKDLREKIVAAVVGRGVSKSQAARTFGVSLSSVKRYVKKADHGESLAPKKSPGSAPKLDEKATKLLEADLKQRPLATLQERRDYVHALTGLSVSRSTICRAIARLGSSRKKGDDPPPSVTSSKEPPGG